MVCPSEGIIGLREGSMPIPTAGEISGSCCMEESEYNVPCIHFAALRLLYRVVADCSTVNPLLNWPLPMRGIEQVVKSHIPIHFPHTAAM